MLNFHVMSIVGHVNLKKNELIDYRGFMCTVCAKIGYIAPVIREAYEDGNTENGERN